MPFAISIVNVLTNGIKAKLQVQIP